MARDEPVSRDETTPRVSSPRHPFFFATYPVLTLYPTNMDEIALEHLIIPIAAVLILTKIGLRMLRFVVPDRDRSALIMTPVVVLFFTFGHVCGLVEDLVPGWSDAYLLVAWIPLLGFSAWVALRLVSNPPMWSSILNRIGMIACLMPSVFALIQWSQATRPNPIELGTPAQISSTGIKPDIYHIILDGYARGDVLEKLYGMSNEPFLTALESRGFVVARKSAANYSQTFISMASTLNMIHLDSLADQMGSSKDRSPLKYLVAENKVVQMLRQLKYEIVRFSSGWVGTDAIRADRTIKPRIELSELNNLVLGLTPLFRSALLELPYQLHRNRILLTLRELPRVASSDGPEFILAHLVCPHPPFVFRSDGSFGNPGVMFNIMDGLSAKRHYRLSSKQFHDQYADQVQFLNNKLVETIDAILTASKSPPVIFIHSDHGPSSLDHSEASFEAMAFERMGILFACLVPPEIRSRFQPTTTPVNFYRILFAELFKAPIQPLQDRVTYSDWESPYKLRDVTKLLRSDEP